MKKLLLAALAILALSATACSGGGDAKTTAGQLVAEPNLDKAIQQIKNISDNTSTDELEKIQREFERQTEGQR